VTVPRQDFVLEKGPEGTTVIVTGNWTDEQASILASGEADGLVLNYARGFRERSLAFLDSWPIRRLDILARTIKDIEPVYRLTGTLQELSLTTSPRAMLDCARLPRLRSLSVEDWEQIRQSLPAAAGLEQLGVYGYIERDLLAMSDNSELRSVRLKQAPRLERLAWIESLPCLESLEIAGAQRLHDLTPLSGRWPRLCTLRFQSCGAITSLGDIAHHTGLRELWVADCGPIASLAPLAALRELQTLELWGSTRFDDGDLTPLLELGQLTDLRMMNRQHYKPSVTDIKAHLGINE
jgi:hypothetical protein